MKKQESYIIRNEDTNEIVLSNHALEMFDMIEEMFENVPDKRKKEYKVWMTEINRLIKHCNSLVGFTVYKIIK